MSEPFIGQVSMFCGNFAPRGWQLCNGQTLSISQYTALFSILGTTYGGNGTTTFNLPNLQGRFAIHPSPQIPLGQSAGSATVTLTAQNIPAHTHPLNVSNAAATASDPTGALLAQPNPGGRGAVNTPGYAAPPATGTAATTAIGPNAGGSIPVPTMPPYQAINFIIAIQGIFPSRN
jgi:microcystin-dependent protein